MHFNPQLAFGTDSITRREGIQDDLEGEVEEVKEAEEVVDNTAMEISDREHVFNVEGLDITPETARLDSTTFTTWIQTQHL